MYIVHIQGPTVQLKNFRRMAWAYLMMTLLLALPSGLMAMNMPTLALMALLPSEIAAITCYICSSYGGLWGCLDPFDYQPIVR